MSEISRSNLPGIIAVGSVGSGLEGQGQAVQGVRITDLSRLANEWDSAAFDFGGVKALLVRSGKPAEGRRALEVKQGGRSVWLSAYTLVCTHEGCTPVMPDPQRQLLCPCHGGAFRAEDGSVISGPARQALRGIRLLVQGGAVFAVGFLD